MDKQTGLDGREKHTLYRMPGNNKGTFSPAITNCKSWSDLTKKSKRVPTTGKLEPSFARVTIPANTWLKRALFVSQWTAKSASNMAGSMAANNEAWYELADCVGQLIVLDGTLLWRSGLDPSKINIGTRRLNNERWESQVKLANISDNDWTLISCVFVPYRSWLWPALAATQTAAVKQRETERILIVLVRWRRMCYWIRCLVKEINKE